MRLRALPDLILATLLAAAVPFVAAPTPAAAAAETYVFASSELALRDEIEANFDVLLLRSAIALRPSESIGGVDAVEIQGGAVAVDGEVADEAALRSHLGSLADPVLALARLGDDRARALLSRGASGEAAGEARLPAERPERADRAGRADREGELAALTAAREAAAAAREEAQEIAAAAREEAEVAADEARELSLQAAEDAREAAIDARERAREELEQVRMRSDARVSVGSGVQVDADEVAEDVVAVGGSVTVDGTVHGSAVSIGGSVRVEGKVTEDVVAVGGRVTLGPNAEVLGNVTSVGGRVVRDPSAKVYGQVSEVSLGQGLALSLPELLSGSVGTSRSVYAEPLEDTFELMWSMFSTLVLLMLVVLGAMLARDTVEGLAATIRRDAWKSALIGLVAAILFFPLLLLVVLVLVISIVGIPLLVLLPFALLAVVVGMILGYAAVAQCVGDWLRQRFGWNRQPGRPYASLVVGVMAIQVTSLVGDLFDIPGSAFELFAMLFALAGFVIKLGAWLTGFGAVLQNRPGLRRRAAAPAYVAAPAYAPTTGWQPVPTADLGSPAPGATSFDEERFAAEVEETLRTAPSGEAASVVEAAPAIAGDAESVGPAESAAPAGTDGADGDTAADAAEAPPERPRS